MNDVGIDLVEEWKEVYDNNWRYKDTLVVANITGSNSRSSPIPHKDSYYHFEIQYSIYDKEKDIFSKKAMMLYQDDDFNKVKRFAKRWMNRHADDKDIMSELEVWLCIDDLNELNLVSDIKGD